jgi:phosphoribosyl 1,2-cyclic phosphodiesterase
MQITVLGSGSSGNCTLIETEKTAILVDAGLSCRQITQRLASIGRSVDNVAGIVVTHEHSDHVAGLTVLCKQREIPVYANRHTAENVRLDANGNGVVPRISWRLFSNGSAFSIGDLTIESFSVPHDAQDPVGFVVHNSHSSLGIVTDLGHATRLVAERVKAVDALMVEANHDVRLLQEDTIRPWATKQRILSRHGHLCNEDAAQLVGEVMTDRLRQLVLAHLSRDCNRPEIAEGVFRQKLQQIGAAHVALNTASQDQPTATFRV